jgi:hypothetical protein
MVTAPADPEGEARPRCPLPVGKSRKGSRQPGKNLNLIPADVALGDLDGSISGFIS